MTHYRLDGSKIQLALNKTLNRNVKSSVMTNHTLTSDSHPTWLLQTIILTLLTSKFTLVRIDTNFLYVCPSCSSGACFCACLWGNLRSVNYVLGVCADLQDFLTHKNTVWVKQYGMLMSMCVVVFWNWKQIYVVFGISSVKVILNKLAHFSKPYSLSDPGDSRPVVSRHTELA